MKTILLLTLALTQTAAFAETRERIKCVSDAKPGDQVIVEIDYIPSIALATNWNKGQNSLTTYAPGKVDASGSTTARMNVTLPKSWNSDLRVNGRKPNMHNDVESFYSVNDLQNQGYNTDLGGLYRVFHGTAMKNFYQFDMMVANEITGFSKTGVKGLIAISDDMMDQGAYHIPLTCSSRVYTKSAEL